KPFRDSDHYDSDSYNNDVHDALTHHNGKKGLIAKDSRSYEIDSDDKEGAQSYPHATLTDEHGTSIQHSLECSTFIIVFEELLLHRSSLGVNAHCTDDCGAFAKHDHGVVEEERVRQSFCGFR